MSHRILQLNELIRDTLGDILVREVSFKPGVLATITKVDTSPDLRHARVSVSCFPEEESTYIMQTLRKEQRNIQKLLHRTLGTKPLPSITFLIDETERNADVVERILLDLK